LQTVEFCFVFPNFFTLTQPHPTGFRFRTHQAVLQMKLMLASSIDMATASRYLVEIRLEMGRRLSYPARLGTARFSINSAACLVGNEDGESPQAEAWDFFATNRRRLGRP
jgi:hypothetical protein